MQRISKISYSLRCCYRRGYRGAGAGVRFSLHSIGAGGGVQAGYEGVGASVSFSLRSIGAGGGVQVGRDSAGASILGS